MVPCVPQFDFTSCQGVLFVLLMTLFFSGILLAILLPFQYVSLQAHEEGGDGQMPRVPCSSTPSGQARGQSSTACHPVQPSWHLP